jgi:tetratricopeptide (TPR) repeat protein
MPTDRIRLVLPLALVVVGVVYLLHIPSAFVSLDFASYETVLYTNDFLNTSWRLLGDLRGKLVPGYFAPLSSITLVLDKGLIGSELPDARVTVCVNLLFHLLNAILLFLLLTRLGASSLASSVAAGIFLLHPIQVPAVMWFAERKTVMATCFAFLSYLAYLKYRRFGGCLFYALSLLAFGAGLLSKPTVVVLPAILVVGEWLGLHHSGVSTTKGPDRPKGLQQWIDRKQFLQLAPFFVMAVAMSLVTLRTEAADQVSLPLVQRPFVALAALWFYLYKIVLPLNLVALYPKWDLDLWNYWWWIPPVLSVLAACTLVKYRQRISKKFLWGLAFFVIPFLPVVGIIRFGYFQFSYVGNHLAYLSVPGAALCLALMAEGLRQRVGPKVGTLVGAGLLVYVAFLCILTWQQAGVWSDPIGLWRHNVANCDSCLRPRLMLAHTLRASNRIEQAGHEYEEILRTAPTYSHALNGLALVRLSQNRLDEAARLLREAARVNPSLPLAPNNLAAVLVRQGRADEATELLQALIRKWPHLERPYLALGQEMMRRREYPEAEKLLRKAVTANPDFADAYATLAELCLLEGKLEEAQELARRAILLRADSAPAYNTLGRAALARGRLGDAEGLLRKSVRFGQNAPEPHLNLGAAFMALGRFSEARESFEAAVRLKPEFAEAHANLGFAQLNLGNTAAAVEHLRKATEINPSLTAAREALERAQGKSGMTNTGTP